MFKIGGCSGLSSNQTDSKNQTLHLEYYPSYIWKVYMKLWYIIFIFKNKGILLLLESSEDI